MRYEKIVALSSDDFLVPIYFPLACTLALLVATTPQLDPRFRVPMIPFLALLAIFPPRGRL